MKMITPFQNKVYDLTKNIPKGRVSTYKAIAEKLRTKAYQAVGSALNKNPFGARRVGGKSCQRQHCLVPCHRVVGIKGDLIGFASGLKKKAYLLKKEGIKIKKNKVVDFERFLYKFE